MTKIFQHFLILLPFVFFLATQGYTQKLQPFQSKVKAKGTTINTSNKAGCDNCAAASCNNTGFAPDQVTAFENTDGVGPNSGCSAEVRNFTGAATETFCTTITTPATLAENYLSFFVSYPVRTGSCDFTNIGNYTVTSGCAPVPAQSFPITNPRPSAPIDIPPPFGPLSPSTTYELCYDVSVDAGCTALDEPCTSIFWTQPPCDLILGFPVFDCSRNDGTYDVTVDYTGGGQGAGVYAITNNGPGTLTGDDPNTVAAGQIIISGLADGSGFDVDIVGDDLTSSCILDIISPSYSCANCPGLQSVTVLQDDCLGNTVTLNADISYGIEGVDYYIEWYLNGNPINVVGASTFGPDGQFGGNFAADDASATTYIHNLVYNVDPGACAFEDQVFEARLWCITKQEILLGDPNECDTQNSVVGTYNALNKTAVAQLDLTALPPCAIAESVVYDVHFASGPPFGQSWICEAVASATGPGGFSVGPFCDEDNLTNAPPCPEPAGVGGNETCAGTPTATAGCNNVTGQESLGGINSTTPAAGIWEVLAHDSFNDNSGGVEGVVNYILFRVEYVLPPSCNLNAAHYSSACAINITTSNNGGPYASSPTSPADHPNGEGKVCGVRTCTPAIAGVDFVAPTSGCDPTVSVTCNAFAGDALSPGPAPGPGAVALYSQDGGATYTSLDPYDAVSITATNQSDKSDLVVEYLVAQPGCPDCADFAGTFTLTFPGTASSPGGAFCQDETVILNATGSGCSSYDWFVDATTATPEGSGAAYTPAVSGTPGTYTYYVACIDASGCESSRTAVNFTIDERPTATAGTDETTCNDNTTLAGNTPVVAGATGMWTSSSSASITSPTSPTSTVTNLPVGTSTFTWTVTNGVCVVSDDVVISKNQSPTVSAGQDQTICGNRDARLEATIGGSATSGTWSGGAGSFDDPSSPTANYTPDISEEGTTVTLTYTTNDPDGAGPCVGATDEVDITVTPVPQAFFTCPSATLGSCSGVYSCTQTDNNPATFSSSNGFFSGSAAQYITGDTSPNGNATFDPVDMPIGIPLTLTYTLTDNGCTSTYSCTFTVFNSRGSNAGNIGQ